MGINIVFCCAATAPIFVLCVQDLKRARRYTPRNYMPCVPKYATLAPKSAASMHHNTTAARPVLKLASNVLKLVPKWLRNDCDSLPTAAHAWPNDRMRRVHIAV
jgi:hypothetical protein